MSLKPWREVAQPHKDVLEGTFKQSEFAADITQVANETATPEYQDPEKFFSRTFITEGMRLLLVSVAQRLSNLGGDPVIQLQTAFGGGKTHTMLAVLHLAQNKVNIDKLEGISVILEQAGLKKVPLANTAVLDGINMSVSQSKFHGDICVNTLWGEMAWQLLGQDGFNLVAKSDQDGTAPGKDVLIDLLTKAAPCVVMIDELQKFFSDLTPGKKLNAGTYEANLKFVQALTESFKAVPNAILLASLPESGTETGDSFGQKALVALEKHFGRVESVWKPVASEEAFEIVRRRLFESAGDSAQIEGICRQYCDFYRKHAENFPTETQSNQYFDRMCKSYPIHPEIFDRLYEDWSTLDKFQRTRGVLQYMAVIIHRLWADNNQDSLVMPGSIPLEDSLVRDKSIHYLPPGWEPVLEREVDGPYSEPYRIDNEDTRFGSVQAAHKTMRSIFLGSAPSSSNQAVKGIQLERILLGTIQPGQVIGIYKDVLKRLQDSLHYLYRNRDRFWLDTKPNLLREMESRKQNIDKLELHNSIKKTVSSIIGNKSVFAGIHVFNNSVDVPDDFDSGPRLVVLPPSDNYTKANDNIALRSAEKILSFRGDKPRQKQNRLLFLAPDADEVNSLYDAGRSKLAWSEINNDIKSNKLNLDLFQSKLAKDELDLSETVLLQTIREAYKWILCPIQLSPTNTSVEWETVLVSTNSPNLIKEIENKLYEEEWITSEWSAIHLKKLLENFYFKDDISHVSALKIYQDTCCYLYLPRLINDQVYKKTINEGVKSKDFFGFAAGKDGDSFLGFSFGNGVMSILDDQSLLISKETALKYREKIESDITQDEPETTPSDEDPSSSQPTGTEKSSVNNQFYGVIKLDPLTAKLKFSEVVDEVIQQFTSRLDAEVTISVDIQANSKKGFEDDIQRSIKENCNVLDFSSFDFEDE